jgi:AraC-like DNA-binding protein
MDNVFAGQMFAGQWRAGSSEADKQKEAGKVLAKLSPLPEKDRIDDLSRVLTCFADGLMLSLGESKVKYASTREEQIRLFIERNYHKQISLSDLAAEMCVSESRASHLVNQYCNTSFQEALIQRRLAAAKSFLLSVEMRISEIAFAVGFNDPYYFSRIFKKKIGMSPKDFRAFSAKSK